ncbi:MAG: hypothetical protein VB081_10140, partial [Christensenella sp.]
MAINTKKYIEQCLKIKNKKGEIVPLRLNTSQIKYYEAIRKQAQQGKPIRVIVLKARQTGFSTLTEAMIFKSGATAANVSSGIVAHEAVATDNLFRMSKRYYECLDEDIRPALLARNAKELIFSYADGNSSIKCMTAGSGTIGRSDTFQNLHISEYAFWAGNKAELLGGLLQAVPDEPNTMVIIESTANGYDDYKKMWDQAVRGESDFIPIFCPWWEHAEYSMPYTGFGLTTEEDDIKRLYGLTNDQLEWRRSTIRNKCAGNVDLFHQEYPASPDEAFLMSGRPVFNNKLIMSRIAELEEHYKAHPYDTGRVYF